MREVSPSRPAQDDHTEAVLPFAVTQTPLRALIHTAFFLGSEPVPVFEIRDCMAPRNEILVDCPKAGAALAEKLGRRSVVLLRGTLRARSRRGAGPRAYERSCDGSIRVRLMNPSSPARRHLRQAQDAGLC